MAAEIQALTDADFGGAPSAAPSAPGALTDADFMQPSQPSVSQPPVKQATTYLSDKNTVVGHPADMSHDQVNDAIQTQIYGRPRNDLHENAPSVSDKVSQAFKLAAGIVLPGTLDPATAEKAAVEGGKGLIRGTEDVGKGLAGLVKWLGASMEFPGIDATGKPLPAHEDILSEGVRAIGSKFTEVGQKAINFLKQREELGFEAPDPEIFRGSFVSNPSFARLAADVAQGVPALGAAALTTIATGNPIAGAGALGLIGAGQQFEASQEEGASLGRSAVAATASGIGNTILMALPLGDAMKGFEATGMKAVVKGAAEFGGVTAVLTPFNNIVAKLGGDKARQLFDGMTESILAGAVSGGILGSFAPGRGSEIDGLVQDAHKAGVSARDIDGARAEIAKQMKENPDAIEKAIGAHQADAPVEDTNQYVKNSEFKIGMGENDKTTAKSIREEFAGIKNEQIVRGNQLADEIRRILPKEKDREGLFWFKAANGDTNHLAEALNDPALAAYHDQIKTALNLPPQAAEAIQKVTRYYDEAGQVAQDIGTISNVRENYMNRIYAPEPKEDFVKTEMKSGIKQTTRHAKQRVFDTEFDAQRYKAGKFGNDFKGFATTDVADALSIHNEELARVNTSRKMLDTVQEAGLGAWKKERPDGWEQVGQMEKSFPVKDKEGQAVIGEDGNQVVSRSKFYAPPGIAKGLEAISDPDFTKKIGVLRETGRYQGLAKTLNLSYSFFHHFSMAMQSIYQGGVGSLLHLPTMEAHLASPDFQESEQDFVKHTGMTAAVDANQDILRKLITNRPDVFSKIVDLPGIKQAMKGADASADFLFGKVQRFLKVSDYGAKMSNWLSDNPNATNAEVTAAKKGYAKEINAAYGGLNWEAMGMTKSNLSLLRLVLLAPDWTISNIQLLGSVLGKSGTARSAAVWHIANALVTGTILTEGLNKILTGHFTDKNKPGHKLEVEIAPDVYASFFRGGIGDILKFGSMVAESGLQGVSRFAQGKLAQFPRSGVGLLTNTQYTGAAIGHKSEGPIMNTYDVIKYLAQSLAPVPLGMSNFAQYMGQEKKKTFSGGAAVLTGLARYSRPPKRG